MGIRSVKVEGEYEKRENQFKERFKKIYWVDEAGKSFESI